MASLNTLRYGSSGPQTELLQLALTRAGFSPGVTDGIFGNRTLAAVRSFQKAYGLASDGIVGSRTLAALRPYLAGYTTHVIKRGDTLFSVAARYGSSVMAIQTANPDLNPLNLQIGDRITVPFSFSVVPNNISFSSVLMEFVADGLAARYPFIRTGTIGRSVMGTPLYSFSIGIGANHVFYNGSHHANEWITTPLLLTYLENYADSYARDTSVGGEMARSLYNTATLYMVPLVNPDGVDLVTGELKSGEYYRRALEISRDYPRIPFPSGWKANIAGTDLNLQYPAGWDIAREIKFAQGYVSPAPRDYVGTSPLSAPESRAVYDYTRRMDFSLTLSYHSQGAVIYWKYLDYRPPCAEAIGIELSSVSGYPLESTPYESGHAGYKDWFIYEYFRPGYTVEVGNGVSPLPLSQFDEIYRDNAPLLSRAQTFTVCGENQT